MIILRVCGLKLWQVTHAKKLSHSCYKLRFIPRTLRLLTRCAEKEVKAGIKQCTQHTQKSFHSTQPLSDWRRNSSLAVMKRTSGRGRHKKSALVPTAASERAAASPAAFSERLQRQAFRRGLEPGILRHAHNLWWNFQHRGQRPFGSPVRGEGRCKAGGSNFGWWSPRPVSQRSPSQAVTRKHTDTHTPAARPQPPPTTTTTPHLCVWGWIMQGLYPALKHEWIIWPQGQAVSTFPFTSLFIYLFTRPPGGLGEGWGGSVCSWQHVGPADDLFLVFFKTEKAVWAKEHEPFLATNLGFFEDTGFLFQISVRHRHTKPFGTNGRVQLSR